VGPVGPVGPVDPVGPVAPAKDEVNKSLRVVDILNPKNVY
jgi:hypothetical protein